MLTLGSLAFSSPWLLLAIAGAPVLWWLLRVTPPAPLVVRFPAIRLLAGLRSVEETPARTPWWLILLRLLLALLLILGLAHPLLHPSAALSGSGPLLLVVDDDWAAAKAWPERQRLMRDLIDRGDRAGRKIVLLTTAKDTAKDIGGDPLRLLRPAEARGIAASLLPKPWPNDRKQAGAKLARLTLVNPAIFWLSDGLDSPGGRAFAEALGQLGVLNVLTPPDIALPRAVTLASSAGADLTIRTTRANTGSSASLDIEGYGADGSLLMRAQKSFAADTTVAETPLQVPLELRNRLERIVIGGENTAAATLLLDSSARRGAVGIVTNATAGSNQPLLSGAYYIGRALEPYAELRRGTIGTLAEPGIGMLVLPDGDIGSPEAHDTLGKWVEAGGVLLRFAGPALADEPQDTLLPVTLRRGGRSIGGIMSWEKPAHLAPFSPHSPFQGLTIPDDVTVERQVLAEPSADLDSKTWMRLSDGTPLVTSEKRGKGWIVLVHTSANSTWSNLVLSGLFVDMLKRLSGLSSGSGTAAMTGSLAPWRSLDGFGHLSDPDPATRPLDAAVVASTIADDKHPPGYYGTEEAHIAFNLGSGIPALKPLTGLPEGAEHSAYGGTDEVDLRPLMLGSALMLALADLLISYAMRGVVRWRRAGALAAALLMLLCASGMAKAAASNDGFAINATKELHFGYILTGDPGVDATSRAGLAGLGDILQRRTAVEAGDPVGVDVERNELIFFPVIYWPITAAQKPLSPQAAERVNRYLDTGGTFLMDTRDQGTAIAGNNTDMAARLRTLLAGVHLPPLVPVQPDHVLTRSFYLMQDFPGRWLGGTLWVEPVDDRVNDGVSTIVMGSNDWASAWAVDANGDPQFPVVPGGEEQREQAYRFGVNLVMYALTGNYKADQVHVPAILERLGQ